MENSPVSCWHYQPCPTPLLTRLFFLCLLPMDFYFRAVCQVTHLFLQTLGSRSLPGLSCCGFTDFGEHLHALGSMGTTHWKALTVHSNNKDSTPWFAGDKTFSTQIHAGFRRWAISHQQFVVMFDQCYCSKKLYPFNFENHLHSIYTDSLSFSRRIKSTLTVIFTGRDVRYTLLSLNNLCKCIFDLYVFKKY